MLFCCVSKSTTRHIFQARCSLFQFTFSKKSESCCTKWWVCASVLKEDLFGKLRSLTMKSNRQEKNIVTKKPTWGRCRGADNDKRSLFSCMQLKVSDWLSLLETKRETGQTLETQPNCESIYSLKVLIPFKTTPSLKKTQKLNVNLFWITKIYFLVSRKIFHFIQISFFL